MKRTTRTLVSAGTLLALLLCLLISSSIAILKGDSLGWFADNAAVTADGMDTELLTPGVDAVYKAARGDAAPVEVDDWSTVFSGLRPRDTVTLQATYTNSGDTEVTLIFSLVTPSGGDEPLVLGDGTKFYHLSTQLRITRMVVGTTQTTPNTFLLTPPDNGMYYPSQQSPTDIAVGSATLAVGQTVTVELTFEFVNRPVNQNVYQNFGVDGGTCTRFLKAQIS